MWFHLRDFRVSRMLFAVKLADIAHEQTISCKQLFEGKVVGFRPMKNISD